MRKTSIMAIGLMCLMTLSLLAPVVYAAPYSTAWTTGVAMGNARMQAVVVQAANGTIYIMGGATGSDPNTAVDLANSYDPSTGAWKTLADMTYATRGAVGAVGKNGLVYVISGDSANTYTQIYNPATNSWDTGTDIPQFVWEAQGVGDGDHIYVIGGSSHNTIVQIYDIAGDSWSSGTAMPVGTEAGGAIYDNGYVYVIGGEDASDVTDAIYRYDVGGDSWRSMASLPFALCAQGVALFNGVIYSFGGADGAWNSPTTAYDICQYYDIKSNTTGVEINYLNTLRAWCGGAVYNGKIFALGGDDDTPTLFSSVEVLDASGTMIALKNEVANLQKQLANANANIVGLTNKTDVQKNEITQLENEIADLLDDLNQTEQDLNSAIDAANNNANSKVGDAQTAADSANMMALIGVMVGIVGIVIAIVAVMMAMKKGKGPQQMVPQQGQIQQ